MAMKNSIKFILYLAFAGLFIAGLILKNAYLIAGGFLLAAIYYLIVFVVRRNKGSESLYLSY